MRITIEKKHEGKIVYGLGWGNNQPRGSAANPPIPFKVFKVNRKYVRLIRGGGCDRGYHPWSGKSQEAINGGHANEGYQFFESLQDIEGHVALNKIKAEVLSYFRRHDTEISEGQARTIHAILFPNQTAE